MNMVLFNLHRTLPVGRRRRRGRTVDGQPIALSRREHKLTPIRPRGRHLQECTKSAFTWSQDFGMNNERIRRFERWLHLLVQEPWRGDDLFR